MSAEPVAVAEVYRAHYGWRTRNVGFNSVRLLVSGDSVAPGDKLYDRATLDAAVAAARAEERAALAPALAFVRGYLADYASEDGMYHVKYYAKLAHESIRNLKPEDK